jgi:O-antigen ligase
MILMLFPVYVLYFTKSRGGLFAFAAALLVFALAYILYKYKMYRSANAKGIIAFLVAILAFFAYKIGFSPSKDYSREQIYKYSWEMIKSHPVFGIGLGDFQNRIDALSASNEQFRAYVLSYALHPHNLYLALWLYLGIPGLIVFLVIIWQFLSRAFSSLGSKIAIFPLAAMTAILAHGLVDTTYFKNDLSAIFFLTLAFAVIIKEGQKKETQNAE